MVNNQFRFYYYFVLCLPVLAWLPFSAAALENLQGSARIVGGSTRTEDNRYKSLDQQYQVNFGHELLPYVKARVSLSYYDLLTYPELGANNWHGIMQPSADLTWANSFFSLGANWRYRETRDFLPSNNALSRGAGVYLKTRFQKLPQSTLRYDWNENSTSAGLQPLNNEERRFQYSANYFYKTASFYYNYTHRDLKNLSANTSQNLQQHVFRLDYAQNFFSDRLRFSGDYLFNYYRRQEETSQMTEPVALIPPIQGLYIQDDSPEFGALDTLSALIDNNLTDRTFPAINIGGAQVGQNIGLNLGIERQVSLLYICVDRPSDPAVNWTVYTSEDNLDWTLLPDTPVIFYNISFNRYEVSFSETSGRYFKVVNSGINEESEVYITEIQALLRNDAQDQGPDKTTNHRVNLNSSYQLHRTTRLGLDAVFGSMLESTTGEERREANFSGTVTYHPRNTITAMARYQHGLTDYTSSSIGSQESDIFSVTFLANPLPTVEFSLSGSQSATSENHDLSQRTNSALGHISALILPDLSAVSELGFSRSDRFSPDFTTDTWTYRISTDANPHENLNVVMNYTVQLYASDQPGAANRRDEIELNTNYRLTPTLFLRGGASYMQEDQEHNLIQDYSMSWNLTNTISTNFSGRWQLSSNYNTRTLGSQINFLLSSRTNMYFSYSQNRIENTQAQETVSYQAGFNTSF